MLKKIGIGIVCLVVVFVLANVVILYKLGEQSQNIVNAGLENGTLKDCPDRPSCVNSFSSIEEHAIAPFLAPDSVLDPIADIKEIISEFPRVELMQSNENYLHAVFRSKVFSFADDFELLLDGSTIQVRSVSRVGESDLGVNRERVELIRTLWEEKILAKQKLI